MEARRSSPEAWRVYNSLWRTYYRFQPRDEHERVWYEQSLTRLNQLGDQRRLRLLSSQSAGVPGVMWVALLGAGVINIALVLFSILALAHPFAGITRVKPDAFEQAAKIFDDSGRSGSAID